MILGIMLGRFLILVSLILFAGSAYAQTHDCDKSEPACVLDAAWSAALILPDEKRDRLAPAFLEIAALSSERDLVEFWEARLGRSVQSQPVYPDYGWQKAAPILQNSGVDGLIEIARKRHDPLSFGRADALLSAGKRLLSDQPASSGALNEALLDFARSASSFEAPNLAHAAAELAMVRCDLVLMEKAISLTDAPNNLRYAFWKARVQGGRGELLGRVRSIDNDEDTREVRRVLDGYRAILEFGYCKQNNAAIGG